VTDCLSVSDRIILWPDRFWQPGCCLLAWLQYKQYKNKLLMHQCLHTKELYSNLQSTKLIKICHKNHMYTQFLVRITESHKTHNRSQSEETIVINFADCQSKMNLWPLCRLLPDSMFRIRGYQSRVLSHRPLSFYIPTSRLIMLHTDWGHL
jgi:hypothetical protein